MSYDDSLVSLNSLKRKYTEKAMNESDTRFQIIDRIIEKTFFWPKSNIKTETKTNEGYTDYQLTNDNQRKTFLVIEAKREKINFNFNQYKEIVNNRVKVKVLLKDENTKQTIEQVKNYCNDIGCKFACITNGHEWAFFRTYIDGKSWQDGNAYILTSIEDFITSFSDINKYLVYNQVVNDYSLNQLFEGVEHSTSERYESKLKISGYTEQISNNHIDTFLRPYFNRYFGSIRVNDEELLEKCYVAERGYEINFDSVTRLLEDALSPYMIDKTKLINIDTTIENQDTFSNLIEKIIIEEKKAKVLVLFGGKGSGKTTFLVNLFNNKKNTKIKEHSILGYVNLLNVANDKEAINDAILQQLVDKLDQDKLLSGGIEDLTDLFKDKYDVELKQTLAGLDKNGDMFALKRNELIHKYKQDTKYCLNRLSYYWRSKQKAIIINIDNTDQFDQSLQNYCFSVASELSESLHCISIISLREERYVSSNIDHYLDAYEKNGFHISSPRPQQVFLKRLDFIKNKINTEDKIDSEQKEAINILFNILVENLIDENSEFNKFMTAATHGNIRHGLTLFKSFLFSHYTNINEMVKVGRWQISLHQILKPIMIPIYRFYDEKLSDSMPNIYKLRSEHNSSHFTAYRILNKLAIRNEEYLSVYELESYFVETFNMGNDFKLNIEMLLKRGMIESENSLEKYDVNLQQIKITSFGYYMQDVIFKDIAYLELVCVDLAVLDRNTSNSIVTLSNEEYKLLKAGQERNIKESESNKFRYDRVHVRINKVETFIKYLYKQEQAEVRHYTLSDDNLISAKIRESFIQGKRKAVESAQRILGIKVPVVTDKNGVKKLRH